MMTTPGAESVRVRLTEAERELLDHVASYGSVATRRQMGSVTSPEEGRLRQRLKSLGLLRYGRFRGSANGWIVTPRGRAVALAQDPNLARNPCTLPDQETQDGR